MSRQIKNDHPWDEFEIQYHIDRNRLKEIEQNKRDFPPGSENKAEDSKVELQPETVEFVKSLTEEETAEKLTSRGLSTDGTIKEQKFRLAQDIQKEKDANGS